MDPNTVQFPGLGLNITINRVAFSIGGIQIYWYGILITLGIALAVTYALKRAKSVGLDPDRIIDATIGGVVGAIVGARLYWVIFTWDDYKDNLLEIFSVRDGGLGFYGGLIGGLLVGAIVAKIRKLKLPPILDLAGIGFLIGQALGRWGNFFNHEAFGSNTTLPWGMTSVKIQSYLSEHASELSANGITVDPSLPVHPCFFYESIWCAIGFVLLHFYLKHRKFDGEVFLMYVAWYGFERFIVEGLRTDSLMIGQLRASQAVAAISVIAAVLAIIIIRGKVRRAGDYVFYVDTEQSKEFIAQYEESKKASKTKKSAVTEEAVVSAETEEAKADDDSMPEAAVQEPIEDAAASEDSIEVPESNQDSTEVPMNNQDSTEEGKNNNG